MRSTDTIFAVASGYGRSGVAVVRVSGPAARPGLLRLAGLDVESRVATLRTLVDPDTATTLDRALVLFFPGPASFTGEDVVEYHLHGGAAVKAAVLAALAAESGCRPAEAGEFTRRAFLNGKMDLSAVEGLADLIDAETEAQRRQALRQLEGALARAVEAWRERLIDISAGLEAALDFTDQDDVPDDVTRSAQAMISSLGEDISHELRLGAGGERVRDGFVVVIAGPPNAGKSTLLNAIARRDIAIVSPVAGTTRDAIEVRCDLGGLPIVLVDTAGLRDSTDPIERIGVERARDRAGAADLVLWLTAPDVTEETCPFGQDRPVLPVRTKVDLRPDGSPLPDEAIAISALSDQGLETLLIAVRKRAAAALVGAGDAVVTRERHRLILAEVLAALNRAEAVLSEGSPELAAEDIRLASRALGRISGRVDVEDVLDRIFAQFCIGK